MLLINFVVFFAFFFSILLFNDRSCKPCPVVSPSFLCGSDNHTYSSYCRLDYHNCIHEANVKIACKGFCPCRGNWVIKFQFLFCYFYSLFLFHNFIYSIKDQHQVLQYFSILTFICNKKKNYFPIFRIE